MYAAPSISPALIQPPYVSGRWYLPPGVISVIANAASANSARAFPFRLFQPLTLVALGTRVTTVSAGGGLSYAIYSSDALTKLPTGTPLASVSGLSTATATTVSATLGAPVTLQPGLYWMAGNADNSAAQILTTGITDYVNFVGGATLGGIFPGGYNSAGRQFSTTYGTWPDLTSASATGETGAAQYPVAALQAG